MVSQDLPAGDSPQKVLVLGSTLISAGLNGDWASSATEGEVVEIIDGMVGNRWDWDPTALADLFFGAALDGSTLFLGGGSNGTVYPNLSSGQAVVLSLPYPFQQNSSPIAETEIQGAMYVRSVVIDADGVYLIGWAADGAHGFAMKCTKDLECPAVPAG